MTIKAQVGRMPDGSNEPEDSLTMMRTPDLWPKAFLALAGGPKDRSAASLAQREGLGILVARPGIPRTRVFTITIFDGRVHGLTRGAPDPETPHIDYDSFEAMVAAGWLVD